MNLNMYLRNENHLIRLNAIYFDLVCGQNRHKTYVCATTSWKITIQQHESVYFP